jgi:hypothetical protein
MTKVPFGVGFFGNVTGTPVRHSATTPLSAVATQGAWRIPTETICSFQAAILQTLTGPFGGWARWGNKEDRCNRRAGLSCGLLQMNQLQSAICLLFTLSDCCYEH